MFREKMRHDRFTEDLGPELYPLGDPEDGISFLFCFHSWLCSVKPGSLSETCRNTSFPQSKRKFLILNFKMLGSVTDRPHEVELSSRCVSPFQRNLFSLHCIDVQAEDRLPPRVHSHFQMEKGGKRICS